MTKKASETFKKYAQHWREVAAHVQPPLSDKEMPPFYEKMVGSVSSNFSDLVVIGEQIKMGAAFGAVLAKKEEANTITTNKENNGASQKASNFQPIFQPKAPTTTLTPSNYFQASYRPPYPAGSGLQPPPTQPIVPENSDHNSPLNGALKRNPRVFTPIPVSYSELLQHLLRESLVATVPLKHLLPPYLKNYDPNTKCDYQAGAVGHSTKKCWSLKHKVQDLVDAGWLRFQEENPNINNNPFLEHGNPTIGAIFKEDYHMNEVEKVKTPMKFIFGQLVQHNMIWIEKHQENYPGNNEVRRILQNLMDKGLVQVKRKDNEVTIVHQEGKSNNVPIPFIIHYTPVGNAPRPLELHMLVPLPYKSSKAVPWKYDVKVKAETSSVTNIARIVGIIKSG
ncbi:hypothetical protein CR513_23261, partial [Mucuna pruriens]